MAQVSIELHHGYVVQNFPENESACSLPCSK